jgi:hypothetical protein
MASWSSERYGYWREHHGKIVKIHGVKHRLNIIEYETHYPSQTRVISVHAEPIDYKTAYYLNTKHELGDDWSVDVLDSDVMLQAKILRQVEEATRKGD